MKEERIQEGKINLQLKNKKQNLKEKGITLIALVVTIILLLILAGVTISQIAGSNGLFQRTRQAVEKYKNAAEEEQIQIGMLEKYVSDFSVVVGDEGESKASVTIKEFTVSGDTTNKSITVKLTIDGQANKIEYSIDNGKNWTTEETISEEKTKYEHTFEGLDLGKSYYVRVKVYDTEGKYVEAISDIVTLSNSITAEEKDVLRDKTYLAEDGSVKTGTMPNNEGITATLDAGKSIDIPLGYTSGGRITAKDLASQTQATASAGNILSGKSAYVNGIKIDGNMKDKSGQTAEATTITKEGDYTLLTIPESGYYNTNSKIKTLSSKINEGVKPVFVYGGLFKNGTKYSFTTEKDYDTLYMFFDDLRDNGWSVTGIPRPNSGIIESKTVNSTGDMSNSALAEIKDVKKNTTITIIENGGVCGAMYIFALE